MGLYSVKKGQITIFIIIALVIIGGIIAYFALKDVLVKPEIPKDLQPVYSYFESCVSAKTKEATSIMGSQAGYLELPDFEQGSDYMPFSSQLDFYGFAVPYWEYVSQNGIIRQQIPTKTNMEEQLNRYLEDQIARCSFYNYEQQGFSVVKGQAKVRSTIQDEKISLAISMPLTARFGEVLATKNSFNIDVTSKLGKFYKTALDIYNKEEADKFLENYGLDVLWLYAPMTGVEMTCAPKTWDASNVTQNVLDALEANVQAIKINNNNYKLLNKEHKYFVVDVDSDESVNFLYSRQFPTRVEIWPSDNNLMIAEPVGTQEGLGTMGFCYVPYHFVYDLVYPVMVQVYNNDEIFQFPLGVVILKNQISNQTGAAQSIGQDICNFKLTTMSVSTYDKNLQPVAADIKYKCFDTTCRIGKTAVVNGEASYTGEFPQCVNGFMIAQASGYKQEKYQIDTVEPGVANILLSKLYNLSLDLKVDGRNTSDRALIYFDGEVDATAVWPDQKSIELAEGSYNISVYAYRNTSITLPEKSTDKCVQVSKSGLLGVLGGKEEKCFTVTIPQQSAQFALSAGGKQTTYFIDSQLENKKMEIQVKGLKIPTTIDELASSYAKVEEQGIDFAFS